MSHDISSLLLLLVSWSHLLEFDLIWLDGARWPSHSYDLHLHKTLNKSLMEEERGDFLGGPVGETLNPNAGGPGMSSGQWTRSHRLQLKKKKRSCMLHLGSWCSLIN